MSCFFKFLSLFGVVFFGEVFCMNNVEYWEKVANNTKPLHSSEECCEDAENALGGADTRINWDNIKLAAEKGNSLAQYVHSQHLFVLSRSMFNGERSKTRFDAYMYLLIAAVKGEFSQAIESFDYAVDFTEQIPSFGKDEAGDKAALKWIFTEASNLVEE